MSRADRDNVRRARRPRRRSDEVEHPDASEGSPRASDKMDLFVPYVLLAISAQRAHGYLIEQYLRGLGLAQVEMSTLYRTLRQLERQGLVTSAWEPGPEGPARRVYTLTGAGEDWLKAGAGALAAYRSAIDAFFGKYRGAPTYPGARRPRRRSDEVEHPGPREGSFGPPGGTRRPRVRRKKGGAST